MPASTARPAVVVTRALPASVEDALRARFSVQLSADDAPMTAGALQRALCGADALLPTVTDHLPAELLAGAHVRIIANFGVGVNHIDLAAAAATGIVVTNTPGVLTDDTADLTLALMLMVARRLGEGERAVRAGAWSGWAPTNLLGASLRGRTLGIIGYGRIGRAVARRASLALGMTVLVAPRRGGGDGDEYATVASTLDALLAESDVVSLHCPLTSETSGLIDARRVALMKASAYLINTARGGIVDPRALIEALRAGRLAGAALDVYDDEPRIPPALRQMENVVLLPHLGSATVETRTAMGMRAVANLDAFFRGDPPPDRVA